MDSPIWKEKKIAFLFPYCPICGSELQEISDVAKIVGYRCNHCQYYYGDQDYCLQR
jgi:transposase-like protein